MASYFDTRKNISDRGQTDMGTGLFYKGEDGKYHFCLPVTNMPATGSAPDQQEKTVTTDRVKTYTPSRPDSPQKEFTFNAHRDNFIRINKLIEKGGIFDFLQLNPDYTAYEFSGKISSYQDEVSGGSNLTGKLVITVSKSEGQPIFNAYDLIEDTVAFDNEVPDVIFLKAEETAKYVMEPDPAAATVTATADTQGVATAQVSDKTVTITAVSAGSCLVTIEGKNAGASDGFVTILVIVTE